MAYPVLVILLAAILTSPVAVWMWRRARPEHIRRTQRNIVLAFVVVLSVLLTLSALDGYFYPYGWPGHEVPGLRSSAMACARAYSDARTPAESTAVDALIIAPAPDIAVPSCGMLRRERLPRCGAGSRCARLRSALGLPPG
jgi:hypothetical protein